MERGACQTKQKQAQAQKVLQETNQTILMLEGGVQAKELLLKKIESSRPANRYSGARPTISQSTIKEIGAKAFINASLIMFQKIANVLSIISFIMVASMSGGAYFGYKYVTSENFKSQVMNEILGNVQGAMPKVLDNVIT